MMNIPEGLTVPEIFLPRKDIDMRRWATIACDQHSSNPGYWARVEAFINNAPSTLHMMLPEIYLGSPDLDCKIQAVAQTMQAYRKDGTVVNMGEQLILLERQTSSGIRTGLLVAIDLEHYNYEKGSRSFVRASEETLPSRLPSRIQTREKASFDMSHILLLTNKADLCTSLKQYARDVLYSVELMEGGRKLEAYSLDLDKAGGELARWMDNRSVDDHVLTGDGNHSLAAAQHIWKQAKANGAASDDPRRWALVEIVSVYDRGLSVYPIHRVVANSTIDSMRDMLEAQSYTEESRLEKELSTNQIMLHDGNKGYVLDFAKLDCPIILPYVETVLERSGLTIDYIHGDTECVDIAKEQNGVAVLLPMFNRSDIFPYVEEHGCFPRKTFSLGTAEEKRYYADLRSLID